MSIKFMKQVVKPKPSSAKAAPKATQAQTDDLYRIAQEVEVLSHEQAFALADDLLEQKFKGNFKLGGVLAVILDKSKAEGADKEKWLKGYATFTELCEKRFKFDYQTGHNKVVVYKHILKEEIPWEVARSIGWTKVLVLVTKKVLTKENAAAWAIKAEHLSVAQLRTDLAGSAPSGKPTGTLVLTIKHQHQKEAVREALKKAKEDLGTKYDAVALHCICQAYLGNAVTMQIAEPSVTGGK